VEQKGLRGSAPARIDDKGRLKVPTIFRTVIHDQQGPDVFVTSLPGECVRIYPITVWTEIERKALSTSSNHPALLKFLDRVNYYGQSAALDNQGRVIIHPRLRVSAHLAGDVDVFGQYDYLDILNHNRFVAKLPP
jgi:MraZ protein